MAGKPAEAFVFRAVAADLDRTGAEVAASGRAAQDGQVFQRGEIEVEVARVPCRGHAQIVRIHAGGVEMFRVAQFDAVGAEPGQEHFPRLGAKAGQILAGGDEGVAFGSLPAFGGAGENRLFIEDQLFQAAEEEFAVGAGGDEQVGIQDDLFHLPGSGIQIVDFLVQADAPGIEGCRPTTGVAGIVDFQGSEAQAFRNDGIARAVPGHAFDEGAGREAGDGFQYAAVLDDAGEPAVVEFLAAPDDVSPRAKMRLQLQEGVDDGGRDILVQTSAQLNEGEHPVARVEFALAFPARYGGARPHVEQLLR